MKKGDRVIIEGPNGYELGDVVMDPPFKTFIMIEFRTGTLCGMVLTIQAHAVHEYDEAEIDRLTEKYGYEKRFAKEF